MITLPRNHIHLMRAVAGNAQNGCRLPSLSAQSSGKIQSAVRVHAFSLTWWQWFEAQVDMSQGDREMIVTSEVHQTCSEDDPSVRDKILQDPKVGWEMVVSSCVTYPYHFPM